MRAGIGAYLWSDVTYAILFDKCLKSVGLLNYQEESTTVFPINPSSSFYAIRNDINSKQSSFVVCAAFSILLEIAFDSSAISTGSLKAYMSHCPIGATTPCLCLFRPSVLFPVTNHWFIATMIQNGFNWRKGDICNERCLQLLYSQY